MSAKDPQNLGHFGELSTGFWATKGQTTLLKEQVYAHIYRRMVRQQPEKEKKKKKILASTKVL